jgi:hypothetical protein
MFWKLKELRYFVMSSLQYYITNIAAIVKFGFGGMPCRGGGGEEKASYFDQA